MQDVCHPSLVTGETETKSTGIDIPCLDERILSTAVEFLTLAIVRTARNLHAVRIINDTTNFHFFATSNNDTLLPTLLPSLVDAAWCVDLLIRQ